MRIGEADWYALFRPLLKEDWPFRNILAANIDNTFTVLYALKPSVVLPQDRGLLPEAAATEAHGRLDGTIY